MEVDAARVRWRRLAVTRATIRLPGGAYAKAAWGGLQDSAPRAALLALHARLDDVGPDAWEHPDLVQIWFRWADYVVPRVDVGVFTVGAMPRDQRQAAELEQLADAIVEALDGGRADSREVANRLDDRLPPFAVRLASPTGRIQIRWDARTVEVIAAERPSIDAETARLELARRFLHWLGPASVAQFAKWAKVSKRDAKVTLDGLVDELAPVSFDGRSLWILADDRDSLAAAAQPRGVRLLPMGDPCLYLGDDIQNPPPPLTPDASANITSRLVNSLTGRVVLDGDVVGAWGRVKGNVTIDPWPTLANSRRDEIEAEAMSFAEPMANPISVRWLPRRAEHV